MISYGRLEARRTQSAILLAVAHRNYTESKIEEYIKENFLKSKRINFPARSKQNLIPHLKRLVNIGLLAEIKKEVKITVRSRDPNEDGIIERTMKVNNYLLNVEQSPVQVAHIFNFIWYNWNEKIKDLMETELYYLMCETMINAMIGRDKIVLLPNVPAAPKYPMKIIRPRKKTEEVIPKKRQGRKVANLQDAEKILAEIVLDERKQKGDFVDFLIEANRKHRAETKEEFTHKTEDFFKENRMNASFLKLITTFPDSAYVFFQRIEERGKGETVIKQPTDTEEEKELGKELARRNYSDDEIEALFEIMKAGNLENSYRAFFLKYFRGENFSMLLKELYQNADWRNMVVPLELRPSYLFEI